MLKLPFCIIVVSDALSIFVNTFMERPVHGAKSEFEGSLWRNMKVLERDFGLSWNEGDSDYLCASVSSMDERLSSHVLIARASVDVTILLLTSVFSERVTP